MATLPDRIHELAQRWSLTVGAPFQPGGATAWVAPARDSAGTVVLKVLWPHPEARHEADGLRLWEGDGAVRLHAEADLGDAHALLLECCVPGTGLSARPEPEQDTVIAGLLRRIWREPEEGHPFQSLEAMCAMWANGFDAKASGRRDANLAPASPVTGSPCSAPCPRPPSGRSSCAPTSTRATCWPPNGSRG